MSDPTPVEAFDQASLESFTTELVAAGFEPAPGTMRQVWTGPIHPALASLTDARDMSLWIRDGWPVVFPYLFAEGLHTNHLTSDGYICLWHEGDGSREWITLSGFFDRLISWSDGAQNGWDSEGLAQDAQLNFRKRDPAVATFDLGELQLGRPGTSGSFYGKLLHRLHVSLHPGRRSGSTELEGLWIRSTVVDVPPRNLAELRQVLNRAQGRSLDRALESRRSGELLRSSGSIDLILFAWDRDNLPHVLVLALEGTGTDTAAVALRPGPRDEKSLILRAGPDADLVADRTVVVFGLGALGGHTSVALAGSGVTQLRLVDGDQLFPENAVRHVIGHHAIGHPKPDAVAATIADHAPWTDVSTLQLNPMSPDAVGRALVDADLVVDATGGGAATQAICLSALARTKALVSGALFRGGAISRVRRQGTPGDVPILDRTPALGYRSIPPGDGGDLIRPAVGCSGPVTNAPPTTVLAAAALIAETALDALTGRLALPDEIIDVYRTLPDEPPFDRIGRVARRVLAEPTLVGAARILPDP